MFFSRRRGKQFVEMDEAELLQSIGEYVRWVETAKTSDTCKCDFEIMEEDKDQPVKRMRLLEMSLTCPVHTKEGFLLGFTKRLGRK
jgi:hypothetical protein